LEDPSYKIESQYKECLDAILDLFTDRKNEAMNNFLAHSTSWKNFKNVNLISSKSIWKKHFEKETKEIISIGVKNYHKKKAKPVTSAIVSTSSTDKAQIETGQTNLADKTTKNKNKNSGGFINIIFSIIYLKKVTMREPILQNLLVPVLYLL
jgi:hypothetical protein